MREGLPSLTATAVCAARAAYVAPGGRAVDPMARRLLPFPLRQLPLPPRLGGWFGLVPHVGLRTLAIDAACLRATSAGIRQLVLLGAGLDARGYRLSALSCVRVFEVDHPATQRFKVRAAARLVALAQEVIHVAVRFGDESLESALQAKGFDAARPSCFLWEGVTPYLPPRAMLESLRSVANLSAPGSVLAVTYGTEPLIGGSRAFQAASRHALTVLGEPLLGITTPRDFHAELNAAGFQVDEDSGSAEWAMEFAAPIPRWPIHERLVVATRMPRGN